MLLKDTKIIHKEITFLIVWFILLLLSAFLISYVQQRLFFPRNAIYFEPNLLWFGSLTVIFALISIQRLNPCNLKNKLQRVFLPVIVLALLLMVISLNSYSYVTYFGVHTKGLFSYNESFYNWGDAKKVEVALWPRARTIYEPEFTYTIIFEKGYNINLFQWEDIDILKHADRDLVLNAVPFMFSVDQGLTKSLREDLSSRGKDFIVIEDILDRNPKSIKRFKNRQNGA